MIEQLFPRGLCEKFRTCFSISMREAGPALLVVSNNNDGQASSEYGSEEESFILQLNRIIAEHISDPELDQQLICKELGVSRALLYNKMKAITGRGTKEYINHIRLEKAKSIIETTSLSIAEISEMTGFSAQSYFSTAFKGYTGLTPSQYKQKWNSQS